MASNSSSSNLFFPSQTPASPNFLCKVCLRSFHSERGLLLHRKAISKCNRLTEHITSNSSSSNLYSPSQTPSSPNFLCKACLRSFHSERGLLLHRDTICEYNRPTEHITITNN
ncbi:uncharacterized protein OCT59_026797 [Rhizophagus irregularis]|uniref:C2H2-type domain-containing protein n=3 Tax=Rhizophagus irregularis TaxID=588596 RepID=U9TAV8_RHIID|nr:hypothetical protein GLOIN_2v1637474 [Rhizophagus irregularis DAOM 181602=DAOM 197198]EXX52764.1 hypothetical protein RirG_250180 [Rhizophagus irregularis DAOM 197198w]PKK80087.1 hypothetical protein RhiirC2_231025 [Rhizophagus irregularis]POG68416.1 hypothetical protein GLOIN_2v1637474 [Rhizophagus irregularis DAOM 181602=DAOM 197198]UZO06476.1 hypothetical protein OCT59_026797 [Rhizophagus irregularis]CAB4491317.1 unnamed protein product [Rhizophagus irregularis]|eukprot:XP_025175282.1 hypothetical protein GLOIN_2v1637474 [Rhizophagus irregularis DAOM 181602=DAOM 197198]